MTKSIDEIDLKIVRLLHENSLMTSSMVAGYLGLHPSTVTYRIRRARVAVVGDEVVGFLFAFGDAFSDNYVMKRRVGNIQAVHVKRGFRQRGIATSLMREAIGYLAAIGCSAVLTETGEDNKRSLKVLTRLGFKQRGMLATLIHEL